ncbi:MAG: IPTL-CTERM sorting domain-containing protein, partial [Pseudomonadota bacterium]
MKTIYVQLLAVVLAGLLFAVGVAQAQTTYDVLFDLDRNAASGCSVTPTGGSTLSGYERRLRATVDTATLQVTGVELQNCDGSLFQPGSPSGGPYAVGLNTGTAGADVVELAVTRSALSAGTVALLELAFVANADAGSDVLATQDGSADGNPILFGLPFQVPTLSIGALIVLTLALLFVAWLAHRRMSKLGAVSAVLLVSAAVWAANFAADGDVSDWGGQIPNATDPNGDASNGSSALDIVAGFAALENEVLFFRIDVVDLENQAPVAVDDAFSTDEDTALNEAAPGVLANDSDADLDPITAVLETGPSSAQSFTLNADGSFDYTPNDNFNGTDSFTYVANDGSADSAPATVTITVNPINDPPVTVDDTATTLEDDPVDIDVLANDSDVDGNLDPASVNVTAGPANGGTAVNASNGVITYTPDGDFNGVDSFTYEVCDDGTPVPAECATAAVEVTVNAVNDVPSFTPGGDVSVLEDAGAVDQAWASAISAGPADEAGQVLSFNVTANDNAALFAAGPAIDPTSGNLSFTPAADANGSANITIELMDDGGTADGGVDTSAPTSFTITVTAVNDAPSFTPGPDQNVLENAGAQTVVGWATAISTGPADEAGQMVSFAVVANDNPGLFSAAPAIAANGTLSYTPAASGTANLTVELMDDGGTANGGADTSAPVSFAINVLIVNDAPSFTGGGNVSSDEDAGAQTVAGWASAIDDGDGGTQMLMFNITANDNPSLFAVGPAIDAGSGNLTYTAAANASGSANIAVELMDDGGTANGGVDTSPVQNFTITINPINDPPTATGTPPAQNALGNVNISVPAVQGLIGPLTITDPDGAGGEPFSVSGGPGAGVTSFTSANGGNVTISNATTGTYTYNPAPGFEGADSFDYVVCDSGVPAPAACSAAITVNLTVSGMIWFVDASASAGGDGRLGSPFNDLGAGASSFEVNAADAAGDNIFISSGNYQGGLTLLNNQRLIGEGATGTLAGITGLTPPANSAALPALGGTRPVVTSATNGVNLGSDNTLRGFNIGNAVDGIAGSNFGTLSANELLINGSGRALILDVGTANNVTIDSISSANSASDGLLLRSVSGSFTVTGLTTVDNAAGVGVNIQNSPAAYTFGNVTVNNRNSTGISINAISGGVQNGQFGNVTINNQNASATSALDIANVVTGGSTITVASVAINNGGANSSTLALQNNDGATININGGNVQNATGASVRISNSAGVATYAGSITNTVGRSVQVENNGGGGVITFSGNITDSGTGIFVDDNDQGGNATVNFTGNLSLNTGTNNAFTVIGGGIVNATNTASTVNTSTGIGVLIENTAIGGSGVTFRSVSVNGANNGILLNNTGSGSFNVTGDGTAANNNSGGTIQNTISAGIRLVDASNVSLNQMRIRNTGMDGITGSDVINLAITRSTIIDAGNAANENGIDINGLFGTGNLIENSSITRSAEFNVRIQNNVATNLAPGIPDTLTVSNSTFGDNEFSAF